MWPEAYLEQARSDWETYELIEQNSAAACHCLHYLQMTTEKLGKAVLLKSGTTLDRAKGSHKAFSSFLRVASRNPALAQELRMNRKQLQEHIYATLWVAHEIERLAPALARCGPNAEYPWESPSQQVIAPVSHNFRVMKHLTGPGGRNLLKLIRVILEKFESLF